MYYFLYVFLLINLLALGPGSAAAQTRSESEQANIPRQARLTLAQLERDLQHLGDSLLDASSDQVRIKALRSYIPLLTQALKVKGSFYYPFDSLRFMFKLQPEDDRFRMLNWNLQFSDGTFRYFGVIQMAPDEVGAGPAYYPLIDHSREIVRAAAEEDTVVTHENWYGAQFYDIRKFAGPDSSGPQYVLLGWDGYQPGNNKKLIEVLRFREDGTPVFGAPIFEHQHTNMETGEAQPFMARRREFLFKEDAYMALKFIPQRDLIAIANLVPFKDAATGQQHMVPDGAYNYYEFREGRFFYGEDLFSAFSEDELQVAGPEGEVGEDGTVKELERTRPEKEKLFRNR